MSVNSKYRFYILLNHTITVIALFKSSLFIITFYIPPVFLALRAFEILTLLQLWHVCLDPVQSYCENGCPLLFPCCWCFSFLVERLCVVKLIALQFVHQGYVQSETVWDGVQRVLRCVFSHLVAVSGVLPFTNAGSFLFTLFEKNAKNGLLCCACVTQHSQHNDE